MSERIFKMALIFNKNSRISWTFVFVIAVCLFLVAVGVWSNWQARSFQIQEMTVATSNLSRAMAQQADATIKEADTILVGLVERVENGGADPSIVARLQRFLRDRVVELPQLNGLFVYDEVGEWIASAQPSLTVNLNNSDREYFVFHRTHPDRGPHIGLPIISRSSGKWIMPVSRRINHADGSFAGVALATIEISYFLKFYDSLDIGTAGAVALISESGVMMARRPNSTDIVGKSMVTTQLYLNYVSHGPVGTAYIQSSQDGVNRLNNFRRLESYPLFVSAALSKDEILAAWRRDAFWHAGVFLSFILVIAFVGRHLVVQLGLRTRAEAEVVRARDALESLNKTLYDLAMQDGLTGLANRRKFDMMFGEEFSRATRNASTLALIMIDVDCFKQFNDIYGHTAGDECLRTIGKTIAILTASRPGDLVARYGGEEIVVLLPDTDVAGAVAVAEKIRIGIRDLEIVHGGNVGGFVTLSAGVNASVPAQGVGPPTALIEAADKALYAAKATGRNRVCVNDESAGDVLQNRPHLE